MSRGLHRRAVVVVAVLAGLLSVGSTAASHPAGASEVAGSSPASLSACTATSGVLVAVDFGHFHGPVDVGCAPGTQSNGLVAMHTAGFLTAGDDEDGDGFVCRIGLEAKGPSSERPTPAEDPCVSTPPASAYWGFFVARPGKNTWSYSESGVSAYQPSGGAVEGWAFGSGGQPSVTPDQVRAEAAPPTTTTTSTPTASTTSAATTSAATTSTTVASSTTAPPTTTTSATTTSPTSTSTTRSSSSTTTSTTAPRRSRLVAVGRVPYRGGGASGTSTGLIAAAALVAVLAAAGSAVAWRRRRTA